MKSFDQIIDERRSVRKYLEKPVEEEKILACLEAARRAPSACNTQPWRFVVVSDPAQRERLIKEGLGIIVPNLWAKNAPVFVVAASDRSFFTDRLAGAFKDVEYHLLDIGMAFEHFALKAAELDLGSCYIGWFNGKNIKRLLALPASWKVECLLTLGYPAEMPPLSPRKGLGEIAFRDRFGTSFGKNPKSP